MVVIKLLMNCELIRLRAKKYCILFLALFNSCVNCIGYEDSTVKGRNVIDEQ